jgi:hypothetical protein
MVRTQTVLPDCSVFVPALEAEAYRQAGARNVVAVPNEVQGITATRNWILRNTRDRWVVMIDDDVRTHGWVELLPHAAMKQSLDAAQWLAVFRKIFEVTEGVGYRIWGIATDGATRAVYPFYPFRWRSYVTASCMGVINDGRTYFEESYPVKEDYELCARCITGTAASFLRNTSSGSMAIGTMTAAARITGRKRWRRTASNGCARHIQLSCASPRARAMNGRSRSGHEGTAAETDCTA